MEQTEEVLPTAAVYLPFWQAVHERMSNDTVLTIVASKADDIITLSVIPQKADKISPVILSGTAEDFAEQFFTAALQPPAVPAGLNVTSAPAAAEPEKKEAKKPATPAAPPKKKKTAPAAAGKAEKKPVKKSAPAAKKSAPAAAKKSTPETPAEPKRGRGRPPGSLNKKGTKATPPAVPNQLDLEKEAEKLETQTCRVCGCTQDNCKQCIEKTGEPCHWIEPNLCSACVANPEQNQAEVIQGGELPESLETEQLTDDPEQNSTETEQQTTTTPALKQIPTATPAFIGYTEKTEQTEIPAAEPLSKDYTKAHAAFGEWIKRVRDVAFFAATGEPTCNQPDTLGTTTDGMLYFHAKYVEGKTVMEALTDAVNENHEQCFYK